ncbi:MAG: molybdopterin-binding protein, partial [Desulfovibrionaceae bacterium]
MTSETDFWTLRCGADLADGVEAWLGMDDAPLAGGRGLTVVSERRQAVAELRAGDTLADADGPLALVLGRVRLCQPGGAPAAAAAQVRLLRGLPAGAEVRAEIRRTGPALAWVTLSDSGFAGNRADASGPRIAELVGAALPLSLSRGFLLPDEGAALRALLADLALFQGFDLICTTGGTGVTSRDVTPE